jgi:hypothetical protein
MDEHKEFNDHHLPHLLRYVVPIMWNPMNLGSGVLVNIGGRHFAASAAHCIQQRPVVMIAPAPVSVNNPVELKPLFAKFSTFHNKVDIGYVEIDDPGCEALTLDNISYAPELLTGQVHVVGYPATETNKDDAKREILLGVNLFSTTIIEATSDHLRMHYPKKGTRYDAATGTWNPAEFPRTPHGFSGGGTFVITKKLVGGIEIIEYKLVAIQSCWMESERYVEAVPVDWLRECWKAQGVIS